MKSIVITTINKPTKAIKSFAKFKEYNLIVVGDLKTPIEWKYKGVKYISVSDNNNEKYKLNKYLPYNHYCRKMLGYLWAIEIGSSYIYDTDDDNYPNGNWGFPEFELECDLIHSKLNIINIYKEFTESKIWPRGFPLEHINTHIPYQLMYQKCKVGIWQGLANNDPDVDAIYRITSDIRVNFEARKPVVISEDIYSPFNSQNTLFRKELFQLLYLPCTVTFRFTDILRSIVAQPIMWSKGFKLGFIEATVTQLRNPHDYMKDFIDEIPMYKNLNSAILIALSCTSKEKNIPDNMFSIYKELLKEKIVEEKELNILESWLNDIE